MKPGWVTRPTQRFYRFQTWFALPFLALFLWIVGATVGQVLLCLALFFVADTLLGHAAYGRQWARPPLYVVSEEDFSE